MALRYFLFGSGMLILDQLTKFWIRSNYEVGQSTPVIQDIFHMTYVENSGAAFGLFPNQTWFFIAATIVFIMASVFYRHQFAHSGTLFRVAFTLGMSGAIGNLIDRVAFGRVTDFLDFRIWPVFNVADSAITVGVIVLAWTVLTEEKREAKRKAGQQELPE